jgi:hypothetical protein
LANLIHANGDESTVVPANPSEGFTLAELYRLIGCSTVQAIELADGCTMWMDEEAKLFEGLQCVNMQATRLLAEAGGMPGDEVIGNVLITESGEVA